jgi:carbohydrate-selective porin OprB
VSPWRRPRSFWLHHVPTRPDDSFGLGIARTHFSNDFVPFLRQQLNLGLDNEDALEMYCNAAMTKWLSASADLQIIDPALKKRRRPRECRHDRRGGNSRSWPVLD